MDKHLAASNVRHLRTQREWTQDDLAAAVGVTQGYIGHIELCKRAAPMRIWAAIADALEVDLDSLIKVDLSETEKVIQ